MKTALLRNILICLLTSAAAMAQDTQREIRGQYRIVTQPTQLLVKEITLGAEYIKGRRSIGIFSAYRSRRGISLVPSSIFDPLYPTYLDEEYRAFTAGISSKYYFLGVENFYLEGQLFYRHWWQDPDHYSYQPAIGNIINYEKTDNMNAFGSKLLIGYTICLGSTCRVRPLIGAYTGIGLRLLQQRFRQTEEQDGVTTTFRGTESNAIRPSFQLGFSLGIALFTKPAMEHEN